MQQPHVISVRTVFFICYFMLLSGMILHGGLGAMLKQPQNDTWLLHQFGWEKLNTDPYRPSKRAGHSLTLLPALSSAKKAYFLLAFGAHRIIDQKSVNALESRFAKDCLWLLQVRLREDKKLHALSDKRHGAKWTRCVLDCKHPDLLLHQRSFHSATLLPDGRILITGGRDRDGKALTDACFLQPVASDGTHWSMERSVLFPPAWRPGWSYHSATLLASEVFIIGQLRGTQANFVVVYNTCSNTWSMRQIAAGMNFAMGSHRAVRVGAHILLMSMDRTPLSKYVCAFHGGILIVALAGFSLFPLRR